MEHCRICNDTGVRNNGSQGGMPCRCGHVPEVLYFGCWNSIGHYLRNSMGDRQPMTLTPWGAHLDGALAPRSNPLMQHQEQGVVELHHRGDWTAIAFWDRSVDNRPGSNSAFVAKGRHTFPEMLALFQQHFPGVVKRFQFPLREPECQQEPDPPYSQLIQLWKVVKQYMVEEGIGCREDINHDSPNRYPYEFLQQVCGIAGYPDKTKEPR